MIEFSNHFVATEDLHEPFEVTLLDSSRFKALIDRLLLHILISSVIELVNGYSQDKLLDNDILLIK